MSNETNYPKETETQATIDPVPAEFDSAIAPQGYEPELVEEIADMETPGQKRRQVIRGIISTLLFLGAVIFFCAPNETELPPDIPIPYGIASRELPRSDLFLYQIAPKSVGGFNRVHQNVERSYQEPFVGAEIATSVYVNDQGQTVTLSIINASSYINANRYLEGLSKQLEEEGGSPEVVKRIWLQHSFVEWDNAALSNQTFGFAWSNEHFYFSATSALEESRNFFAENFPY
ncbi:MAG: hypothetical protein AAF629_33560 [Chloroflexota bacterium]